MPLTPESWNRLAGLLRADGWSEARIIADLGPAPARAPQTSDDIIAAVRRQMDALATEAQERRDYLESLRRIK